MARVDGSAAGQPGYTRVTGRWQGLAVGVFLAIFGSNPLTDWLWDPFTNRGAWVIERFSRCAVFLILLLLVGQGLVIDARAQDTGVGLASLVADM
jgi:hypothetical protein